MSRELLQRLYDDCGRKYCDDDELRLEIENELEIEKFYAKASLCITVDEFSSKGLDPWDDNEWEVIVKLAGTELDVADIYVDDVVGL